MTWLWQIALRKVATRIALLVCSYAAAWKLQEFGITLDQEKLTVGIYALLEWLRNYLKVAKGIKLIP